MVVNVILQWSTGDPSLSVTADDDVVAVTVDPRVSDGQMVRACSELGELGPTVLEAWRQRVGLRSARAAR